MATAFALPRAPRGTAATIRRISDPRAFPGRNANLRIMWRVDRALQALFRAGRRSIAIVDTGCGSGTLLIEIARRARAIGFLGIEATGIAHRESDVTRARDAAAEVKDPAIGFAFQRADGRRLPVDDAEADLTITGPGETVQHEVERATWREGRIVRRAGGGRKRRRT